jgi:putative hydrolase of the HAD superfamily
MLKAILFDIDDTLLDWSGFTIDWQTREATHVRRVYDFIKGQGFALDNLDRFTTGYLRRTRDAWDRGRSNLRAPHLGQVLLETAEAHGVPEGKLNMQECLRAYDWHQIEGTLVFPEVPAMLTALRERGIRFGIVTNAFQPMFLRDAELAEVGLLDYFPECRLSAADVGYLKPHPGIFQAALDCLKLTADEVLFVGDNPIADIAGAQGAGLKAILRVKTPATPLISGLVIPDGALNSLEELPFILDDLYPGW